MKCNRNSQSLETISCQYNVLLYCSYTGEQCEVDIAECRSTPCQNEGTCIEPVPAKYVCQCSEGFEGENCEKGK